MKNSDGLARVLLVYYSYLSFVKNDYSILSKHFKVERFQWHGKADLLRLALAIRRSDVTFVWFASDHAAVTVFFSRLFRKPSIVFAGGGDVAYVPEIGYGGFTQSRFKQGLSRYALKNADLLLPVSGFTKSEVLQWARPRRMEVVYNGVDVELFRPKEKKEDLVVAIGKVTEPLMKRKCLETFARASLHFPDHTFAIIGRTEGPSLIRLKEINPDIISTGYLKDFEVLRWLQWAGVYCQLSCYESFGVALAEAMACGCIPVVTDRGALREVVGDSGFYVPYGDENATAQAIKEAIVGHDELDNERECPGFKILAGNTPPVVLTISPLYDFLGMSRSLA